MHMHMCHLPSIHTNPPRVPLALQAASVAKLVEHLTHERYNNPHFIGEFLLTYRSFTEPGTLLRLLTERYYMPEPTSPDLTPEDLAYFRCAEAAWLPPRSLFRPRSSLHAAPPFGHPN